MLGWFRKKPSAGGGEGALALRPGHAGATGSRSGRDAFSNPATVKLVARRISRDERGNVALIFALAMPAVIMLTIGAIELFALHSDRQKLQDVADLAALAAARELSFSPEQTVLARAKANALRQAASVAAKGEVAADAHAEKDGEKTIGITVSLRSHRMSFFGNLLPPGGFHLQVSATASGMNEAPLCVLGISPTVTNGVNVERGRITANGCVVHSNNNVRVGGSSQLSAAVVQAVGTVTGAASGQSQTGAPSIADPFTALTTGPANWNSCLSETKKADKDGQVLELNPGVHCGHFDIDKTAILRLRPGVHYFRDKLQMKESSRLEGAFATVVFGKDFELQIDSGGEEEDDDEDEGGGGGGVKWDLLGAQTGAMAGFALVVDRARTADFVIPARIIERLEGVAYAPTARLTVTGAANAASDSAWTVVVGKELRLLGDARMQINSDYASSQVPVPAGVGETAAVGAGGNRLVD